MVNYVYTPSSKLFEPVPAMPPHLPNQLRTALYALRQIDSAGVNVVLALPNLLQLLKRSLVSSPGHQGFRKLGLSWCYACDETSHQKPAVCLTVTDRLWVLCSSIPSIKPLSFTCQAACVDVHATYRVVRNVLLTLWFD